VQASRLGSPVLAAVPLYCNPGSPSWQSGPRTPMAHKLGSPIPAAAAVAPGKPRQQAGLRAPTATGLVPLCWYCTPRSPAGNQALELGCQQSWFPHAWRTTILLSQSPCPESRPQNTCCLKAWFPWACSSCHACTSNQAPGLLMPAGLSPFPPQQLS
jgi:hypothetical protein